MALLSFAAMQRILADEERWTGRHMWTAPIGKCFFLTL
jgi:hypothetical protein